MLGLSLDLHNVTNLYDCLTDAIFFETHATSFSIKLSLLSWLQLCAQSNCSRSQINLICVTSSNCLGQVSIQSLVKPVYHRGCLKKVVMLFQGCHFISQITSKPVISHCQVQDTSLCHTSFSTEIISSYVHTTQYLFISSSCTCFECTVFAAK